MSVPIIITSIIIGIKFLSTVFFSSFGLLSTRWEGEGGNYYQQMECGAYK